MLFIFASLEGCCGEIQHQPEHHADLGGVGLIRVSASLVVSPVTALWLAARFCICRALSSTLEARPQSTLACCQPLISSWSRASNSVLRKSTTPSTRSSNWCRGGSAETAGGAYGSCDGRQRWRFLPRGKT